MLGNSNGVAAAITNASQSQLNRMLYVKLVVNIDLNYFISEFGAILVMLAWKICKPAGVRPEGAKKAGELACHRKDTSSSSIHTVNKT
jgi:hypothetical protein